MKISELAQSKIVNNVTYLTIAFLILSSVTNFYLQRYSFVVLYGCALLACIFHVLHLLRKSDVNNDANRIMIILFGIFFTFFFIGKQTTFDILWVLILPTVTIMIHSYKQAKKWIALYLIVLFVMNLKKQSTLTQIFVISFWTIMKVFVLSTSKIKARFFKYYSMKDLTKMADTLL